MIKTYHILKTSRLGKPVEVEGSEFMVFPVTMLVEGVHHAVNGPPAYYPADVLAGNLEAWNGAHVTVGHPQAPDGAYISAKSPDVNTCGYVKDPDSKDKKLRAQVYVKPDAVEPAHLEAMQAGNMEVSTGIYAEAREEKGEWNGEPYEVVIEKIYPDHLALLPNERGACSISDGCGIRANVEKAMKHSSKVKEGEPKWSEVDKTELPDMAFADMESKKYPHHWVSGDELYLHTGGLNAAWAAANGARSGQEASAEVKAHLQAHRDALGMPVNERHVRARAAGLMDNEAGLDTLYEMALGALDGSGRPIDMFPDKIVYVAPDGKTYARDYELTNGVLRFTSEPRHVRLDYVAVNSCCPDKVAEVIKAHKGLSSEDSEWLVGLSSGQINKLLIKEEKMQTLQEYVEAAPEHLRAPLANAVATAESVRQELIGTILTNGASGLTAEQLGGIETEALKGIAKLAAVKPTEPNYALANGGILPVASTVTEEPLVMTGLFQGGNK